MKNIKVKVIICVTAVVVAISGIVVAVLLSDLGKDETNDVISLDTEVVTKDDEDKNKESNKEDKVSVFSGDDRPIAVMIDNHIDALPQAAISKAYSVYEIIVEGGETRLMAIFKGQNLEKVGPIRSSRHYFLDYALENDAIYVHYGWSPQAEKDIKKLKVNNVNGLVQSANDFWRVSDKYAPHNAVSATKNIIEIAEANGYKTKSNAESVLNYSANEIELEDGKTANEFSIEYSVSNSVSYKYDAETKKYQRYTRGTKQVDWDTSEEVKVKNIIITFVQNTTLQDGSGKGRQTLDNIKTCDGYYITNGKAIKIKCEKKSREGKTVYKDLDGNEIKVNDGNTFFQICPIDAEVVIK